MTELAPLWIPSEASIASANVTRFIREAVQPLGGRASHVTDSFGLYDWSVAEPDRFWPALWRFAGVVADERSDAPPWDAVLEHGERITPPNPILKPH